jgi:hypothetical protein
MGKDYEINEKDIDSVINYLKLVDPVNATPEVAITILEEMYATVHTMSHTDPELLDKMYAAVKNRKKL